MNEMDRQLREPLGVVMGKPPRKMNIAAMRRKVARRRAGGYVSAHRRARESTESWAGLLRDCKRRGIRAPVLQIRRMLREHFSSDISLGYFAVLLVGFGLWIGYGLASGNLALVISNSVSLLTAAALVIIALWLRGHDRRGFRRPGQPSSRGVVMGAVIRIVAAGLRLGRLPTCAGKPNRQPLRAPRPRLSAGPVGVRTPPTRSWSATRWCRLAGRP
jgi:MtN3 and saliva related transmembrane protein